uniref:Si:ch211-214c7.5 n=1 Tax=Sinocyclocheilus anshuiensis TaxID=1608454 RepID=A0A671NWV4_9TELE
MANTEHGELKSLCEENEAAQSLTEVGTEKVNAMAPSFGDERCFSTKGAGNSSSCQDKRMMDEKISPSERQLKYLLNKADEFQTQLSWSRDCLQNYGFEPTYLLFVSHRLEQLVLLYASFSFFSLKESDPLSISHFYIGQCQIDNMKLSISRYCCPTPFLASASTGLYKRMRWNVEQEIEGEGEGQTYDSAEFYFLCCEDVIEAADDKDGEGRVERIWSIVRWVQTHPDPETEDITDCEEPSSCTSTDCLLGVLLSQETCGSFDIFFKKS